MSKSSNWWENVKIGGGAAPIETSEGWLLFYHGVTGTCNGYVYSIGGAILDRDDPSKVLYRCSDFLLTPEAEYEERGFTTNVCFPCATCRMQPPAASPSTTAAPTATSAWPLPRQTKWSIISRPTTTPAPRTGSWACAEPEQAPVPPAEQASF